jgi:hypothetical protein
MEKGRAKSDLSIQIRMIRMIFSDLYISYGQPYFDDTVGK